jgi:protein-arginine kinase activator protein McsA
MKKVKCNRCLQTKAEKQFQGLLHGEKIVFETCNECRKTSDDERKKKAQTAVLNYARKLGLVRNKPPKSASQNPAH